jgi:hypothetical protein
VATWDEFAADAPDLAARVRERLDAGRHKTLATLRRDGSPRISGTETLWAFGDLWFGSMPGAVKARDLRRDPRFALHSASQDPPGWRGDAKLAGRAVEVPDPAEQARVMAAGWVGEQAPPPGPMHLFRADITEAVTVELGEGGDHIVITSWHPGRGVERLTRR